MFNTLDLFFIFVLGAACGGLSIMMWLEKEHTAMLKNAAKHFDEALQIYDEALKLLVEARKK